jgi:hypothetical protein
MKLDKGKRKFKFTLFFLLNQPMRYNVSHSCLTYYLSVQSLWDNSFFCNHKSCSNTTCEPRLSRLNKRWYLYPTFFSSDETGTAPYSIYPSNLSSHRWLSSEGCNTVVIIPLVAQTGTEIKLPFFSPMALQ